MEVDESGPIPADSALSSHSNRSDASAGAYEIARAHQADQRLLDALKQELVGALAERHRLQAELEATAQALSYTQKELSNLWETLTTGGMRGLSRTASKSRRPVVTPTLSEERSRIRYQIGRVRDLSRKRHWLWRIAGS